MKKLIVIALFSLAATVATRAQWEVYDPTVQFQLITDTAQEVAKYVQMINNQVQQIQTLTSQLNEFKHYEDLFGDPSKILLTTVSTAEAELLHTELGQTLDQLVTTAKGVSALTYDDNGLYTRIGAAFPSVAGALARDTNSYRPFAAINQATANFLTVTTNATAQRIALKAEIEQNLVALQKATTDAEVQKLAAGLTALSATLNGVDHEVNEALGSALVQDIENRNDEQKQQQAIAEQRQAEFRTAITNYAAKFPLLTDPVHFPTP